MHFKDTFEFTEHILVLSFSNKTVALFYYIKTKPPTRGNQDLKKEEELEEEKVSMLGPNLLPSTFHTGGVTDNRT